MSAEDVELVRALQPAPGFDVAAALADEASTARWLAEVESYCDPAVRGTMRFRGMSAVTYAGGLEGLAEAWRDWLRSWSSYCFEMEDVLDGGDRVVVVKLGRGRPRPGAPETVLRRASIWTVRDGLITQVDFNVPYGEAMSTVGLAA